MLYYTDKNWYHFIKEYLEQISKFAFQEVARPIWWPNRHILEILLAYRHTLVARTVRQVLRKPDDTASVFFIHHFLLIFATQLTETRFVLFRNMFYHIDEMWPAWLFPIGITLVNVLRNWLNWFHSIFLERGPLVVLIDCTIFLWPFLNVTSMFMSTVSFLAQLDSGILCL